MNWIEENPVKAGILVGIIVILIACGTFLVSETTAEVLGVFIIISVFVALSTAKEEGERKWDGHLTCWRVCHTPEQMWNINFSGGYIIGLVLTVVGIAVIK